jgi:hypothetical protein
MGTAVAFDFDELKQRILDALQPDFPDSFIDISPGYMGRAHVVLVSHVLDRMSESEKQQLIWEILKAKLGEDAQGVSLAIGWGVDELR